MKPKTPTKNVSEATSVRTGKAKRVAPANGTLVPVGRREDIPRFRNEREEADFWATHDLAGPLLEEMRPVPPNGDDELPPARSTPTYSRTRPISVRLDEDVLKRIKALAAKKRKGYQSLLKEFLVERLYEEEKREGLIT